MAIGKPFKLDKPEAAHAEMTKFQAFADFILFLGLSAAYIIQVGLKISLSN
jgi:hypothetical protein